MLIWFDNTGALRKNLDYGSPARVGTTNFKIIAYFDDISSSFNTATIKFIKPDYDSSQYPLLFMQRNSGEFLYEGESIPDYFQNGETYSPTFEFDFSHFSTDQDLLILLDTPGMWQAVVTLYSSDPNAEIVSVQGVAKFNVQNGQNSDETTISWDTLINHLGLQLAKKLDIVDGIIVVDTEPNSIEGYQNGQVFFFKDENGFFELEDGEFVDLMISSGAGDFETVELDDWEPYSFDTPEEEQEEE